MCPLNIPSMSNQLHASPLSMKYKHGGDGGDVDFGAVFIPIYMDV